MWIFFRDKILCPLEVSQRRSSTDNVIPNIFTDYPYDKSRRETKPLKVGDSYFSSYSFVVSSSVKLQKYAFHPTKVACSKNYLSLY